MAVRFDVMFLDTYSLEMDGYAGYSRKGLAGKGVIEIVLEGIVRTQSRPVMSTSATAVVFDLRIPCLTVGGLRCSFDRNCHGDHTPVTHPYHCPRKKAAEGQGRGGGGGEGTEN